MNCNIIRNNSKSDLYPTPTTANVKGFPEKNFNRFRPRVPAENMNASYNTYRYHKYKKFNKRSDEHIPTDSDITKSNHTISHDKLESFPFKILNGDDHMEFTSFHNNKSSNFSSEKMFELNKKKFNVSSSYSSKLENFTVEFDSNLKDNAAIVEQAKIIAKDIMNNPLSMENKLKKSNQEEYSHVIKSDKRKTNYKSVNKKYNDSKPVRSSDKSNSNAIKNEKQHTKIKLNFLQESQLTSEQLTDTCNNKSSSASDCTTNSLLNKQINGLNPSALEFTPKVEKKSIEKVDKYSTELVENNIKILNLNGDSGQQLPISNPVVLDDGLIQNPYNYSFYDHPHYNAGKMTTSNDSSTQMAHNIFPYQTVSPVARSLSRMNYTTPTQTIVPQFQVALYGNNPQLIRYNQPQNLSPVNYLVYSPVMINGMYNHLLPNRIFPIGPTADIPAANLTQQFAHPFNHCTINNNHISVPNSQPYFTDSISNNANGSHIR